MSCESTRANKHGLTQTLLGSVVWKRTPGEGPLKTKCLHGKVSSFFQFVLLSYVCLIYFLYYYVVFNSTMCVDLYIVYLL